MRFSAATVSECTTEGVYFTGVDYWTAGQRLDRLPGSPFVWRVISPDMYHKIVSEMTYTNWNSIYNEPNGNWLDDWLCVQLQGCMLYMWDDVYCHIVKCSVCEINM